MKVTAATWVIAENDVVWSDMDGDVVLLEPDSKTVYSLNSVASTIWRLVQSPTTLDTLHRTLALQYEVASDVCERDLEVLLTDMYRRRLITFAERHD